MRPLHIGCITVTSFLFDQITKFAIRLHFKTGDTINVLPVFSITRIENTGASFGLFPGSNLYLAVIALIIIAVLLTLIYRNRNARKDTQIAYSLILGGALGNLFDRILFGHVTDFLLFYWKQHQWPAFNVADSSVFCGVALIICSQLKIRRV